MVKQKKDKGRTMTDKQKQAIKILNSLWNANGGVMRISEEEYFILLECVLGEEKPKIYSPTTPLKTPTLQCYEKDGICTNPFKDCINCPKTTFHSDGAGTFTSSNIK